MGGGLVGGERMGRMGRGGHGLGMWGGRTCDYAACCDEFAWVVADEGGHGWGNYGVGCGWEDVWELILRACQ